MLSKSDLVKLYETVLSIPGMNEGVKIDLRLSRKNILLLSQIIQKGLTEGGSDKEVSVLSFSSKQSLEELAALPAEILSKAGLTEMNEKLAALGPSAV